MVENKYLLDSIKYLTIGKQFKGKFMSFGYITPSITKWKLNDFMCVIDGFEDEIANKTHGDFCIGNDYKTIFWN